MSAIKTEFVEGVKPFVYKPNFRHCIYIGPVSENEAVLYMTDAKGTAVPIADDIEIFSFDTCEYFKIKKDVVYFPMSLSTSYTIRYGGDIFMSGAYDYPLSDRFISKEQEEAALIQRYTILVNGKVEKDSPIIKVSSMVGMEPGRAISGRGIPENSIIVDVDREKDCVIIDEPCLETASLMCIQVQ
jgi:hypothetical protein